MISPDLACTLARDRRSELLGKAALHRLARSMKNESPDFGRRVASAIRSRTRRPARTQSRARGVGVVPGFTHGAGE